MFCILKSLETSASSATLARKTLAKFDPRSNEGISFSYSSISKGYSVYDKHVKVIKESIHVIFDETNYGLASLSSFNEFN